MAYVPEDSDFVASLFTNYARSVLALATALVGPVAADDIVAETFAIALRRAADIPSGLELAWLLTVSRHVVRNWRRESRRARMLVERVGDLLAQPAEPDVASTVLELSVLKLSLLQLQPPDRNILVRAIWLDQSTEEIAAQLSISVNAATVRIHRARRRLIEILERTTSEPMYEGRGVADDD